MALMCFWLGVLGVVANKVTNGIFCQQNYA